MFTLNTALRASIARHRFFHSGNTHRAPQIYWSVVDTSEIPGRISPSRTASRPSGEFRALYTCEAHCHIHYVAILVTFDIQFLQKIEVALDNLERVVHETCLCDIVNKTERQSFFETVLSKLLPSMDNNISEVKSRRNALSPINCLPTEILCYIFALGPFELSSSRYKYIISLSQVCRRWRDIIINDGTFWTTLDFMNSADLVKTVLRRSNGAKLQIEIKDKLAICPEKLALAKSVLNTQGHRVEQITATLLTPNVDIIEDALSQPFPSLRNLRLQGNYYRKVRHLFRIPFTVGTDHLEVLDLFGCAQIPWASLQPTLSNVKKLRLYFEDQDSYFNFFTHIRIFNNLRVLSVRCCSITDLPRLPTITVRGLTGLLVENSSLISLIDFLHTPNLHRYTICDEINHTFRSDFRFDYTSIRHISLDAFFMSGYFKFYLVGSTEQDDIPGDYLWDQEFHISSSSPARRFQIKTHFNEAFAGLANTLEVLNDVLAKTASVLQLRIPNCLPNPCYPNTQHQVSLSMITEHTPKINSFHLVSTTLDSYLFRR